MFTFQIIYDKSTYICPPGMTERAHQHEIETPQTYFIGLSRVVKYVKFSPKSTAYLVSEKSTRIFLKKYVNHHQ